MSKPVYHLVKETKLRQMLKEAGLVRIFFIKTPFEFREQLKILEQLARHSTLDFVLKQTF